jgi:type I restriction enzyme, S subunit
MSQLFGWEGALALSSEKFAGRFLSPQFPTFLCDETRLARDFLGWVMRRPVFWEDLGSRASGMGDRRRTLNPEALFTCEIPLPPLEEQRRLVARIEELEAQTREAGVLRGQAQDEAEQLLICMAHRRDLSDDAKRAAGWRRVPLRDCVQLSDDSYRVSVHKTYANFGIYSFGRGLFRKAPIDGALTSAATLRRVRTGQFVYSRLFAFEGAYGLVTEEYDGHFVSGEYPTFDCNPGCVSAEFLAAYFKAPSIWKEVAMGSKGLGDRRQRVQPLQILNHVAWIPPFEWQARITVTQLKVGVLKRLQEASATEVDALLPAILDRAFNGEL